MNKIYTKTGDQGKTRLKTQEKVWKDSLRIETHGEIDELNSALGVALSFIPKEKMPLSVQKKAKAMIRQIQNDLLNLGSFLGDPHDRTKNKPHTFSSETIVNLEKLIDQLEAELTPLGHFILPGGTCASSFLHLARSISRRAERRCVSLFKRESLDPVVIRYLNRLSDALFVLARWIQKKSNSQEIFWSHSNES